MMSCLTQKGWKVLFAVWPDVLGNYGKIQKSNPEITESADVLIEVIHLVNTSQYCQIVFLHIVQSKFPVSCKRKLQTGLWENMLICKNDNADRPTFCLWCD